MHAAAANERRRRRRRRAEGQRRGDETRREEREEERLGGRFVRAADAAAPLALRAGQVDDRSMEMDGWMDGWMMERAGVHTEPH
jgi:hypothetical protein